MGDLKAEESHRMITGCAVTRGNSEDPVGNQLGDMRQKRQERGARGKTAKHRKAGRRDVRRFDGGGERQVNPILFIYLFIYFLMALKKNKRKRNNHSSSRRDPALRARAGTSAAPRQWTFSTLHSQQRATSIIHHSFRARHTSAAG